MRGWSVRRERVQTGHGVIEELPCLVYEEEGRAPQPVAYLADGRLEHADSYNPYRSIPLEALQLLLEHSGWIVTPSGEESQRRREAHAKRQRFEARLRDDPLFAVLVAEAEERGNAVAIRRDEAPRMLDAPPGRCSVCRCAGTVPSVCVECFSTVLASHQASLRVSAGITEEEWRRDVGPVLAESKVWAECALVAWRKVAEASRKKETP